MEELLNKLIEKGRVPFWLKWVDKAEYAEQYFRNYNWNFWWEWWSKRKSIRDIVSKDSWLWQYVCENKIIEQWKTVHDFVMKHICYADENRCWWFSMCNAEYYIMMCSLLDESELEQFLLDNIKVEWK